MKKIAVIDTETNWKDEVMSIGVVIADAETYNVCKMKYYIITPEYLEGGMYSYALKIKWDFDCNTQECSREQALVDLKECLQEYQISKIFAYNAAFDYHHLPELKSYTWYDIIQHNALCDAADELLCIMKPLGYKINDYIPYIPKNNVGRKKPDILVKLEFCGKPKSYKIVSPVWGDIVWAADILRKNSSNMWNACQY